jgi:hypothetical protein
MADTDTEQEPVRVPLHNPVVGRCGLLGGHRPDIDDAGGDRDPAGRIEQILGQLQVPGDPPIQIAP